MKQTTIPARSEVASGDKWNLDALFADDASWSAALQEFSSKADAINAFRDAMTKADGFAACMDAYREALQLGEKVGHYAFLRKSEDEGNAESLDRVGRYMMAASAFEASTSWLIPAIQSLPDGQVESWLKAGDRLAGYRVWLEKLLRLKPYILSEKEERILALRIEADQAPSDAFSVLTNVDIDFGTVNTKDGPVPLSQSSFSQLLENPDRAIRKETYEKFYGAFNAHKNTIATLYAGNVNQDVSTARIRGYESSRAMALFPDRVPESVYDNLVSTVRANLEPIHRYYSLKKRILGVSELRHYDVYLPLVSEFKRITPYAEAVDLVAEALSPLGADYTNTLRSGLLGGWVDRYENKGKRSGAFSSGGFEGEPYIMLNYKEDVIRDVFTLAHEGGHSMHSRYSARNNPFMSYDYTIFEAEVASTFNEELLFRHLIKGATDPRMKAFLLSNRASDILSTLYRQTMFAEFEQTMHVLVEGGTPLTAELIRSEYRKLLVAYFGPEMVFEETSDLECLRIPHFYNSFYVYKYSTGISAALALAERVLSGGERERDDYFKFLKSGGSRYPIDALRVAGVDMESPQPVEAACRVCASTLKELEKALGEI